MSYLPYMSCVEAKFRIPQLIVDNDIECIFWNFIAFRQCHYPNEAHICCYVFLLDFMIDTKEDVELLVKKKAIIHELGSNGKVADLCNKLGQEVSIDVEKDVTDTWSMTE